MNRQEHLLTILSEECAELTQEICKALRFGLFDKTRDGNNAQRMNQEYNDLLAMVDMVNDNVGEVILFRHESFIKRKKERVEEYLGYSAELGNLELK